MVEVKEVGHLVIDVLGVSQALAFGYSKVVGLLTPTALTVPFGIETLFGASVGALGIIFGIDIVKTLVGFLPSKND